MIESFEKRPIVNGQRCEFAHHKRWRSDVSTRLRFGYRSTVLWTRYEGGVPIAQGASAPMQVS